MVYLTMSYCASISRRVHAKKGYPQNREVAFFKGHVYDACGLCAQLSLKEEGHQPRENHK